MNQPTLSVVMCNYNHGKYISQAIEAIVNQSRPPDQFVILDDGSTDNSVQIIEKYVKNHSFIQFHKNEKNLGGPTSLTKVSKFATGTYIYFAASDDFVLPGFFEKAMDMAKQHPEAGIIFGQIIPCDETGAPRGLWKAPSWNIPTHVTPSSFYKEYISKVKATHSLSGATIYQRKALESVGGYRPELGCWGDTFSLRATGLKYGAYYIPCPFMSWRRLPDSLAHSIKENPKAMLDIIARASYLMKSPEFNSIFPNDHVAKWKKDYRQQVINSYIKKLNNGKSNFFIKLIKKSIKLRQLTSYPGDVSCYLSDSINSFGKTI